MKLYIKHMVSLRCKLLVKEKLESVGVKYFKVDLGVVELLEAVTQNQLDEFATILQKYGLELLKDKKAILIEKIKNIIIEMVHYSEEIPKVKFSVYLSEKTGFEYNYLSSAFSEVMGVTIEHFIISHRIERVKELLLYDELTLTQIAYKLNYSSIAHLSNQFKKITGLTPSYFKQMKSYRKRRSLEDIDKNISQD